MATSSVSSLPRLAAAVARQGAPASSAARTSRRALPALSSAFQPARWASSSKPSAAGAGAAVSGRSAALAAALKQIEASFGKGSVMQLGQRVAPLNVEVISTGSLALDHALGVQGLPKGRVVEIYGPESSGKTTLALHVVAEAQKAGASCCFIDAEHALDPSYARGVGVDLDKLYLSQPDTGEEALEIADTLVRSGGIDVLVVDSVAALVPKAELEGEMGDHHVALQARLMSQALRKLTASLNKAKTLIIFINQIRSKVGVLFGSPDVTTGGNALKFYSSVRMEIRRTGQVKRGEDIVGNLTRVKIAKNKLAPPFRVADFEMTYGRGINRAGEAVDLGAAFGVLKKAGAWYAIAHPGLLAAVRDPGSAAAAAAAAPAAPAPSAPAPAAKPAKGSKKAAAAAAAAAAAEEAAVAATVGAEEAAGASTSASGVVAYPDLQLGEAWLQGREKVKAYFDAHPGVLAVAIEAVRAAMKSTPAMAGAAVGTGKAVAAAAGGEEGATAGDDDDDEALFNEAATTTSSSVTGGSGEAGGVFGEAPVAGVGIAHE